MARSNDPEYEAHLAANRRLWNRRVSIHLQSQFYDVASFEAGASSLRGPEREEFAAGISGKSVLHLQCHFGQDTLSLARLGARITGVDFSDVAIDTAKGLSQRLQIPATFICTSIFDLPTHLSQSFDYVFTSYGVLGWLPALSAWAEVIGQMLKPNGLFYMVEFHPAFQQRDEQGQLKYDYFHSSTPDRELVDSTYTDGDGHEPLEEYWWNHPVSEPIHALAQAGLAIEAFREYSFSPYKLAESMVEIRPGQWVYERLKDQIPYLFSVRARRPR